MQNPVVLDIICTKTYCTKYEKCTWAFGAGMGDGGLGRGGGGWRTADLACQSSHGVALGLAQHRLRC